MECNPKKTGNEKHVVHSLSLLSPGLSLNVGIVGAGIAGLAAAAALSRIGHNVEVSMLFRTVYVPFNDYQTWCQSRNAYAPA
jgi:pyruvate/2-oxoglutarate dehydrogenase complex dihydrolipoamide dehydrogenase (E3) component